MMLNKIFIVFCILLLFQKTNAQTFSVGNTCCNYQFVNKTLIVAGGPGWVVGASDTYTFDVTGDLIEDIKILSGAFFVGGGSGWSQNSIVATSTNNTEFVYTSSQLPTCMYSRVIDNVPYATPLLANLNWSLTPLSWNMSQPAPEIYYYYIKFSVGIPITCGQQTNPFYIGFRKVLPSNDTIYGWIKMDSNFPGKVIDYAYTCGTYTATPPTSTFVTIPTAICKGDSLLLNALPLGGIFSGPGVIGNKFKSNTLSAATYNVFYALPNPNGCATNKCMITLTVNPLPVVAFTNTLLNVCNGDTLLLNATPVGGVFTGTGILGDVFYSSLTGIGTETISYIYTNLNNCSVTATATISVNACVGVKELFFGISSFRIFPNPNNGEFEIKGIKEETIIVTNELGQIIETKNLNSQNNYSAKLNNLQSGIYFVGNQFSKQKIVVIK